MTFNKNIYLTLLLIFFALEFPATGHTGMTALYQSVEKAIAGNPTLKALDHGRHALTYDLRQSRSGYLPKVDLTLGYGMDQHSDRTTREPDADPKDSDWDSQENFTLKMTQMLYDGGQTQSQVSFGKAQLDSATYQLHGAIQSIALEAVTAHLDVVRQQQRVALSEKNLNVHRDIYQLLAEREQAGASSIADVDQVSARMARAQSTLHSCRADLAVASANYTRVTGTVPEKLAYAGVPDNFPSALETVLQKAGEKNPELLALDAEQAAAQSTLSLARSKHKPQLDLELSSRYNNQLEGNPSWESTNSAMVMMRWNLYNGGRDKAGTLAAHSRIDQSRSKRTAKWEDIKESISTTWVSRVAFGNQKGAVGNAVEFSRKTFDAYLNQFSISQRTLLDVLIAENDFYQSAVQLVEVTINETIAAYRILALMGRLQVPRCERDCPDAEEFERLTRTIEFPSALRRLSYAPESTLPDPTVAKVPSAPPVEQTITMFQDTHEINNAPLPAALSSKQNYTIEIGPMIAQADVRKIKKILESMGLTAHQRIATGPVTMFRCLEGIYPSVLARQRLVELKKEVDSAFVLPDSGGLGIYIGSFRTMERALRFKKTFGQRQINVDVVSSKVEMPGPVLDVEGLERQSAEQIAKQVSQLNPSPAVSIYCRQCSG